MAAKTFTANASTNRLTCTGHGLATLDTVRLFPVDTATLPSPLQENVPYPVKVIDANTLEVAELPINVAAGLGTIDLASAGSGTLVLIKQLA